jgi:hypothetical protein
MKKYQSERGVDISITPIPLLLEQIRNAHPRPDVPTYAEKTASGAERQVPMVAEDMQAAKKHNPDWYAQHAEVWESYQAEVEKSDAALNEKLLNAVALKAVKVELPKDNTWAEEQAFLGLDVPDDPLKRRVHYVRTEVLGGPKDIIRVMAIAGGAEVDEEVLARAVDSFRGVLQGAAFDGVAGAGRAVAGEPAADADAGSG